MREVNDLLVMSSSLLPKGQASYWNNESETRKTITKNSTVTGSIGTGDRSPGREAPNVEVVRRRTARPSWRDLLLDPRLGWSKWASHMSCGCNELNHAYVPRCTTTRTHYALVTVIINRRDTYVELSWSVVARGC